MTVLNRDELKMIFRSYGPLGHHMAEKNYLWGYNYGAFGVTSARCHNREFKWAWEMGRADGVGDHHGK